MFDVGSDVDVPHLLYRVLQLYLVMVITVFIGVIAFVILFSTGEVTTILPESLAMRVAVASIGAYIGLAVVVGIIIHGLN